MQIVSSEGDFWKSILICKIFYYRNVQIFQTDVRIRLLLFKKKIKILQGGTLPKLQFSKHINDSIKDLHTA